MKVFSFALWFLQLDRSITMLTTFCCHLLLLVQIVQCKNLEVRGGVPEMQSSMGSQVNQELVRKNPRLFFSVSHSVWNWFHFEVKCEKITLNFSHQKFFNSNIYKKKILWIFAPNIFLNFYEEILTQWKSIFFS